MAFCRCLREVYTGLRIWTYRNVVVDTRGAGRADHGRGLFPTLLSAHIYLLIALGFGDTRLPR